LSIDLAEDQQENGGNKPFGWCHNRFGWVLIMELISTRLRNFKCFVNVAFVFPENNLLL
jgi:hypothetical protein